VCEAMRAEPLSEASCREGAGGGGKRVREGIVEAMGQTQFEILAVAEGSRPKGV